ncbi:hypothetical protein EPO56_03355 [Patescibacteria group bacterium]|nr:MAG: hypothetical protein EPO56_03355 [Patescibacteria group bacterium]
MDLYHALNRGVDARTIFVDSQDYARFIHDMYEFNDTALAGSTYYAFKKISGTDVTDKHTRNRLVDIHGWCLMKNHYHLLLSERVEGGMSLFLRKLNVGYANYFNKRYERTGTLFQGRTKKIRIEHDRQFNYILHYIHLNPLDYLKGTKGWRIRAKGSYIKSSKAALAYLEKYRWSSYLDYCGIKNFPSILTTNFFSESFPEYKKEISIYLRGAEDTTLTNLPLE